MNKKLLELLNKINAKKAEVKAFVEADKLEEAKAAKEELKSLQEKFDILKDMEDDDQSINRAAMTLFVSSFLTALIASRASAVRFPSLPYRVSRPSSSANFWDSTASSSKPDMVDLTQVSDSLSQT